MNFLDWVTLVTYPVGLIFAIYLIYLIEKETR